MSRLRPWLIVGAAVLMAGALVWLILSEHRARAEGTQVALVLEGVDPRSLLSGHYVQLEMRDTMPTGTPCPKNLDPPAVGPGRWVALKSENGRGRVVGATDSLDAARRLAPIAVRGTARCFDLDGDRAVVWLDIGLDRFHASQKEAEAIEAALRASRSETPTAFALVSVGRDGRARLLGIEVEGRRILLDWFASAR
jgi:uncharacterized membrane-anchored protein